MPDLNHLSKYRENNRLEAKKATGGLPESVWETYSAFANTYGGVILLGVDETDDKSLEPAGLIHPEELVCDFCECLEKRANKNILTDKDISIENIGGKYIVVINVPKAARSDRPIYIDKDVFFGTYKRDGDGDYHCSREEILKMMEESRK